MNKENWRRSELPRIPARTWTLSFTWLGLRRWGVAVIRKGE